MPTALKLYDNYTRSLRGFEALKAGAAGLYTCGPTVYDYQHIGNFRTFLFEDRRGSSHFRRRHRRGQDGKGCAAHRQDRVGNRGALYRRVPRGYARAQHRGPDDPLPRHRPHPRADRIHRRHREKRLHVSHFRRYLLRHQQAARLRLPRAPEQGGARGRQARRSRREEASDRLCAVEVLAFRREAPDGMAEPLGNRLSRLAHRVLGDGAEIPWRFLRRPLRR